VTLQSSSLPEASDAVGSEAPADCGRRVPSGKRLAYIVNRFPTFIETMIYREVSALRACGETISIFSIRKPPPAEIPAEAAHFVAEAVYILPVRAMKLVASHLRAAARHRARYWTTLAEVVGGTHTSIRDRFRTLCHFVEAVTILDEIERRKIDHIHAHWAVGAATCAMVVSRLLNIPFSFTAHAYDIWRDRLLLPEKLEAATFVVTCKDYNRQHLARTYGVPLARLRVVYHGVDTGRFRPRGRPTNATPLLLAVGRLVEQKGLDRLVRACALLEARGYRARCEIVGDGPLRGSLTELVKSLGLEGRVTMVGPKHQDELSGYYRSADVFVLPCIPASDQDRDGIPNTLIEAMAMEVPVVSTRFSGIPELVADRTSGLLVEPGDTEGLADALAHLLDRPDERTRLGRAGRERVLDAFAIEGSARRLQSVFAAFPGDESGSR